MSKSATPTLGEESGRSRQSEQPTGLGAASELRRFVQELASASTDLATAQVEVTVGEANGREESTLGELCDAFLLRHSERGTHFAPRTLDLRRQQLTQHVIPLLGSSTLVTAISAADLRRMIISLGECGLSGATIRACVSSASAVFSYGVRELGVLTRNPVRDLERGDLPSGRRQTEPRYLSMEEVELLLDTMTATFRPIAAVCYFAGLRISEALGLKWADIDIEKRRLSVRGTKTRASNATVPLVERLARELIDHRERQLEKHPDRTTADSLVFQTANGRSPVRQNVGRAVSRAANKAGLVKAGEQPVSPHDLRHSFASLLLTSGFSLPEAARLMRHANTQITATAYAGLSNDAIEALTSKLEHATSEPQPRSPAGTLNRPPS